MQSSSFMHCLCIISNIVKPFVELLPTVVLMCNKGIKPLLMTFATNTFFIFLICCHLLEPRSREHDLFFLFKYNVLMHSDCAADLAFVFSEASRGSSVTTRVCVGSSYGQVDSNKPAA